MSTPTESHPFRTAVISSVVAGVVLAVLAELWPPVKTALSWCWTQLKSLLTFFAQEYPVPGWLLLIVAALALATIYRWVAPHFAKDSPKQAPFLTYTTDHIYGAKWRWRWLGEQVENLWCFCPTCDSELVYDDSSCRDVLRMSEPRTDFLCEHCGHTKVTSIKGGNKAYALSAVYREIRRRVRTGQAQTEA